LKVPPEEIEDLQLRLRQARWSEEEPVGDWSQGVPRSYLSEFCAYWLDEYDWYATETRINSFPQFVTELDGLDIHFMHVRSAHEEAKPLILTHGWPGSIIEFFKVLDPLTNPTAFRGRAADACHVVCPSLPGYGFSGKPSDTGWGVSRTAAAWDALMVRLGYDEYYAQGGDWGAGVTIEIGAQDMGHCRSVHVNMPTAGPTKEALQNPTPREQRTLERIEYTRKWGMGYHKLQSTRPQTLGYGLADSPVGQAAWILEKFYAWTDCDGHPENVLSRDELIDHIILYWLTNSGASSARLYWETFNPGAQLPRPVPLTMPVGVSVFPEEIMAGPRSWSERAFRNIVYWNELDKGGHFAAFEQPQLFVQELRNWLRVLTQGP
jgi:pimeloyl-ACP methyl ester carboxylesterase